MVHLVYCDDKSKVLNKILDGSKTMVVRGAAGRKIPHSRVNEGETLYFMQKGSKKISAKATVTHVENYLKLTEEEIIDTLAHNQLKLNLYLSGGHDDLVCFGSKSDDRWQDAIEANEAPTLIFAPVFSS